ncbi:MAG: choice-of-anchor D domain-containing protein [Candidatus Cloacimonetes bacterium]|nr:choice-of-anchor D domain-containing protein [Candidatus Cloacimonadota bacterium]
MKKIFFVIFVLIIAFASAKSYEITLSDNESAVEISENSYQRLELLFNFEGINTFEVETTEGVFSELIIPGTYSTLEIGAPKLPSANELIVIPFGAEVSVRALSYEVSEYQLSDYGIMNLIMPVQPPLSKSQNPEDVEFVYNEEMYMQLNRTELVNVEILGVMRGIRLARLTVNPINYDATRGTIEVYNNIEVEVTFVGSNEYLTEYKRISTYSPYFEAIYHNIINSRDYEDHPDLTTYPLKMLLIADDMFESNALLQEYIEWKTKKGFTVVENYDLTTSAAIQSWIQAEYNQDMVPSFIVIVGDTGQIPASANGSQSNKATDLYYGSVDGDYFPDIYYSRLSATNDTQLNAQLNKILYYEKYEFADPTYLDNVTLIAGIDGSHNPTHGQPTVLYGTEYYYNTAHGYSDVNLYLTTYGGCYDTVNDGIGFINYTAHGSQTSWSGPSLSQGEVNSFTNINKYPVAIGNCCLAADFGYSECFGETWMRKVDGGAVGYIGSAPSSYWDEDVYWSVGAFSYVGNGQVPLIEDTTWGVYDAAWITDYVSLGGLMMIGNLAVTEGGSLVEYYWQAYNVLGDASLVMYNTQGYVNSVSYMDILPIGVATFEVTAEPGSYVAISFEGVLHGTGLIDEDGTSDILIDPILNAGMADIVVTKPQYQPVVEQVQVAPLVGPFLTLSSFEAHDDNNNIPEYNEAITLDVDLENVGTESTSNIVNTLNTDDDYITITDAEETVALIEAGETVSLIDAFAFDVANNIPDQHSATFTLEMVGDEGTWTAQFNITFNAPLLEAGAMEIADSGGDGVLDPGETATLSFPILNAGNATSEDIIAELTSSSPDLITIINGTFNMSGLGIDEEDIASFDIEVADDATVGMIANLGLMINSGGYTSAFPYYPSIGLIMENFETGDFSLFDWQMGSYGWVIDNTNAYEGTYCAKSTTISHNQTASISVTMDVVTDGEISFYRSVSSESNYDYLRFYINNVEQDEWAGNIAWSQVTYSVSAGTVEFKWAYEKDGSVSNGSDCSWIDEIVFPSVGGGNTPIISLSTEEIDFGDVSIGETATEQLTIFNMGTVELSGTITAPNGFSSELTNYSVEAGGDIVIDIEFTPTEAIVYSGDLVITSNDPNQSEVTVALSGTGVTSGNDFDLIPTITELTGNYPNPFNPTTNINFSLKADSRVSLMIYNVRGQKVRTLVNDNMQAGYHSIVWDGRDDSGKSVSSGVYFNGFDAADIAGDYTSVKKMILLK